MKFSNKIDKWLDKIGLVRKSVYDSTQDSWKHYTQELGKAAKEKGVSVLFDDSSLVDIQIDTDVFVLGSRNYIDNCDFTSAQVLCAPHTTDNWLNCNRFFGDTSSVELVVKE